jgi:tetratricopeptide (TPR) repeat protein
LDEEGQVKGLDDSAWRKERERLATLGSAPAGAEPRWRLDPILFGPDPTARAKAWAARQHWPEAEAAYNEVVAARPFDGTVLLERAGFYASRSQPEKAETDCAHAYALGSRDPKLIEEIVESQSLLRRTIAESPGAAAALLAKHALAMTSQTRWQEAAEDFAQELDLLPPARIWNSPRSTRAMEMARWDRAYELLLKLRPDDGHLWCVRGRYHALRSHWEQAAADFARGIASAPPESEEWFEHACLRLIVGDQEGFRSFVQEICRREGRTTNPFVAYVLARCCVQSAAPIVESEQVVRWAEQALKAARLPWYLGALGEAAYRAGRFEQAVQYLEESNRAYTVGRYTLNPDLANGVVLALAQMKLGRVQDSRDLLRSVQQAVKQVETDRVDGAVSLNATEWLPLQLRLREAEIRQEPTLPDDPFAH